MSEGKFTSSEQSTYCSEAQLSASREESSQLFQPRRSERLMSMEKKAQSPQLFEETESECSQIICGQMINAANSPVATKILRIKQGPSPIKIKNGAMKVVRLRREKKFKLSFKEAMGEEIQMPPVKVRKLCRTQLTEKQRSTNPRTRCPKPRKQPLLKNAKRSQPKTKCGRTSRHVQLLESSQQHAISTNLKQSQPQTYLGCASNQQKQKEPLRYNKSFSVPSSPSKLPIQYPAHFIYQLPPAHNPKCSITPEHSIGSNNFVSTNLDSRSSRSSSSLSDSIAKIFGTKDVSLILDMEFPRKYYLLDDHLPAMATMLGVEVDRLRSVIHFTQRLTHEQLVLWPQNNHRPLSIENLTNLK